MSHERKRKLHKFADPGEQISLPCRYCKRPTDMSKELIEALHMLSVELLVKRGQIGVQKSEIAVCESCRPRYLEEFRPDTVTITTKRKARDPNDSPDTDPWPDHYTEPDNF